MAPNREGKFGDPSIRPDKQSKVPKLDAGMVAKIDVRNLGLSKVLAGPQALQGALGTIMAGDTGALDSKMAVAMSGDGGELEIGHGAGGMGFKDIGTGGGGTGLKGRLRGLGRVDTGGDVGRRGIIGSGPRRRPRRVGDIRIGKGVAGGGCNRGEGASSVRRRAAALRACYETHLLAQPSLQGKITARWTISTEGQVRNETVVRSTMANQQVTDCVMRAIRRIRFKKPEAGICVIQWPFVFVAS